MGLAVQSKAATAEKAAHRRMSTRGFTPPALALQQEIGDQAVQSLFRSGALHARLPVGVPTDPLEEEADRAADVVMRAPSDLVQRKCACGAEAGGSGECSECMQKRQQPGEMPILRRQPAGGGSKSEAPAIVHRVLGSAGRPLDHTTSAFMEARFGRDFGKVRIHTDQRAAQSAASIDALAYTVGNNVVFGRGQYAPDSSSGRRLLAHELAHVLQQTGGLGPGLGRGDKKNDDAVIQRDTPTSPTSTTTGAQKEEKFPWIGRIRGTPSAALRRIPHKDPDNPHAGTLADLEEGKFVDVFGRKGGWLHVRATVDGKEVEGYVSQELVEFNRLDIDPKSPAPAPAVKTPPYEWRSGFVFNEATYFTGGKDLSKGRMMWKGVVYPAIAPSDYRGEPSAEIEISFAPKPSLAGKTITFLQTKLETVGSAKDNPSIKPMLDVYPEDLQPFYGPARWDEKNRQWVPQGTGPPYESYKNQPSSATDRTAYLFDAPSVPPTEQKMFETAAVVPETGEALGSLRWGVSSTGKLLGGEPKDCTDALSAEFNAAVERFYATPQGLGSAYDAILDGFPANDGSPAGTQQAASLTVEQQVQLDGIAKTFATRASQSPDCAIELGGFADASEADPGGTSERRIEAVAAYLIDKGVGKDKLYVAGAFGAAWARFPPSAGESRNRRVQIRIRYLSERDKQSLRRL
jgi:hypothetical protein